jgi:DNA-binding transcriptional ArsR family regulator
VVFTMTENAPHTENELLNAAVAWLRERLPQSWEVDRTKRADLQSPDVGVDGAIDVRGNNSVSNTLLVETKSSFSPRDVDRLLGGLTKTYQRMYATVPILLVAPWLSQATQDRLREGGVNYLDMTGNAWIFLENPTLLITTQGARRDPSPPPASKLTVRGPKSSRLIRWLIDVRPPYGVRDLASATKLSPSYVSRLLDTLDEEALVERNRRGTIESLDVNRLLRRWTETYSVLRANSATTFIAPRGATETLSRIRDLDRRTAVTGSFAAVRRAPVAAPALLAVYTDKPAPLADALDLLPADAGTNVLLLKPYDPVVWERTSTEDGISYVADSQAAADCLTGNGRMPAEGQALLEWMTANEAAWRLPELPKGTPA